MGLFWFIHRIAHPFNQDMRTFNLHLKKVQRNERHQRFKKQYEEKKRLRIFHHFSNRKNQKG